jgi:NADH:ubiquinone oxidoreductase subunit F (NADH-binding)/(2Fe-2S) ferredoxin
MAGAVMNGYAALAEEARRVVRAAEDASAIRIQVGSATCEDAAGANEVFEEFRKHIEAAGRKDIALRRTGCTGRCSREPIVGVLVPGHMPVKYEKVDTAAVHKIFTSHILAGKPVYENILDHAAATHELPRFEFLHCSGGRCGEGPGEGTISSLLRRKLQEQGLSESQVKVTDSSCFGLCSQDELGKNNYLLLRPDKVMYRVSAEADLDEIIAVHIKGGKAVDRLTMQEWGVGERFFDLYGDVAFFSKQTRIALRNGGVVDPESVHEYVAFDGFQSLAQVLDRGDPRWVIDEITRSNLRGRGGGGYPTGKKWLDASNAPGDIKYIICNADEGDPGAFMDRSMLEGDPFSVLEGMVIGGFAIGAHRGFIYVRAEYPMAIQRLENAIGHMRAQSLLGQSVFGSGFAFDLEVRLGAGAFVCGEETALIHSIEGERGQPRVRPPYPSQSGLWGKPTVINNVETFSNIPVIVEYGADWFKQIGTEKSGGTKVFALTGKVHHTGLVEVPMGTTLREIVLDIGGGVAGGKQVKAIQTGGPAGGCIPEKLFDTVVDYESLLKMGSIMGSGGMIVMDEDDCMVDLAKFFLAFSQDESCGKCTPCREGTKRMLEILERITSGNGVPADIAKLERLGTLLRKTSLCGLGRAAANPVLSTLKYYREEYEAHVVHKRCPARKCTSLIHYEIIPEKCVGCTACARACPVPCIDGSLKKVHVIDQPRCIKCGRCYAACRFGAVDRK